MAAEKAFHVPVVADATTESAALVPAQFREVHWTRLPAGDPSDAFVHRVAALLDRPVAHHAGKDETRVGGAATRRLPILVVALSVAAVVAFGIAAAMRGGWRWHNSLPKVEAGTTLAPVATTPAPIPEKSVAVLPFVDMSEKKDQEYFSDGLSEELIDMLTKVPDLHVPARTSSFYFKGKQAKISEIARDLGVAHLLEGSVRKSGKTLRVTAQLIRVDSGYHIWSETYDRTVSDVFKVQDEIAAAVVKALQVSLGQPRAKPASAVSNVDAYSLMLRGRFLMRSLGGPDSAQRAVAYYEDALRIEPDAAPIWAGLSRALIVQWANDPAKVSFRERATTAAQRALTLDPSSCDAHVALGKVRYWADWDWAAAELEFKQARALDRQDSYANFFSGELALSLGRLNEALEFYTSAIAQDPLNFSALRSRASLLGILGRPADELAAIRKLAELSPEIHGIRSGLGIAELRAGGEAGSALATIQAETNDEERLWALALAYAMLGRAADADAAIANYAQKYGALQPSAVAGLLATRGKTDAAFEWLDRAYRIRDQSLIDIKVSRTFAALHGDARYKALLRRMNLSE
jgi:TolB-like protein